MATSKALAKWVVARAVGKGLGLEMQDAGWLPLGGGLPRSHRRSTKFSQVRPLQFKSLVDTWLSIATPPTHELDLSM